MGGGYANVAIFEHYKDNLIKELIGNVLVLLFAINFEILDVCWRFFLFVFYLCLRNLFVFFCSKTSRCLIFQKYPKLYSHVFVALALIPPSELNFFLSLDPSLFAKLLGMLQKGLSGTGMPNASLLNFVL
jgi:hypothetical protein